MINLLSGLSLIMVMLMMWGVWPLLIESALILLQTVPTHIDIEKLKRKLLESIDGILAVSKIVFSLLGACELLVVYL
jgi:zinc transporter 1